MTIDDLKQKDSTFQSSLFLSKANSRMKKIFNAITLNELDSVHHFMSENVFLKFQKEMNDAKNEGLRLIYEEVNIQSDISNIEEIDQSFLIHVFMECKYLKYYLSLDSGNVVKGNNQNRSSCIYHVVFKKKMGTSLGEVARCLGCGSPIPINENGKCPHCGRIFDLDQFDYIIESIQ